MVESAGRWIRVAVVAAIAGIAAQHAFWLAPGVLYLLRSPSVRDECASIRPGMTRGQVMEAIHRRTEPAGEYLTSTGLSFQRGESCNVEFDASSDLVTKAFVPDSTVGWP